MADKEVFDPLRALNLPTEFEHKNKLRFVEEETLGSDIPITIATWGTEVENQDWAEAYQKNGSEITVEGFGATGFGRGSVYGRDVNPFSEEVQSAHVEHGVTLATNVLERKKVSGEPIHVDIISDSTRLVTAKRIVKRLRELGYNIQSSQMVQEWCAGLLQSIVDNDKDPSLNGKLALAIALETTTGTVSPDSDMSIFATFANGGVSLLHEVGRHFKILNDYTVVTRDPRGSMSCPHAINYANGEMGKHLPYPAHYRVAEDAQDMFFVTEEGKFLMVPESEKIAMNGRGLMYFFGKPMADIILQVVNDYYERGLHLEYGPIEAPTWSHLPSIRVRDAINIEVATRLLHTYNQEWPFAEIKKLAELDHEEKITKLAKATGLARELVEPFQIRWVMENTHFRNASPATAGVAAVELAKQGLMKSDKPRLMLRFGIGGIMGGSVIKLAA